MPGSDYEHWADESNASKSPKSCKSSVVASVAASTLVTGYDGYNGLRRQTYHPANQEKKEEKKDEKKSEECICAPPPAAVQPLPQAQQQVYYMMGGYPPMQYAPHPQQMQMAYPAPAYYGWPQPWNGMPAYCPPAAAVVEEKKEEKKEEKRKKDKPEIKKWQGRTKAEVEEDNMKIAMREGACDARKVEPKGLKEDQMVWCVEVDGSHTLRTFAAVKEFGGEWLADPRFKDSWYFVREKEKKTEKD